jgi:CubicO group peptidase (beta-lactamase class C family)
MTKMPWVLSVSITTLLFATPGFAQEGAPAQPAARQELTADTPLTTVAGNAFIAPAGWSVTVKDRATIIESPEGNSRVALVDLTAADADAAVAAAWAQYGEVKWPILQKSDIPDRDGWSETRGYAYQVPPEEKRVIGAIARKANDIWTVMLLDLDLAVAEKRGAQFSVISGRLLPKGMKRESFAGRTAKKLDAKSVAEISRFIDEGREKLGVPGVSIGIVQDGKILFAGGFGKRHLDKPEKVDADTLYMIASNTKALTTLMLAKLVDEKKLSWDTPVTKVLPSFKLGDAETTKQVLVKHLICACTGLPRQDLEWLFEFENATPASAMATLGTMQPTSKFGELFQYSNPLAAAGGYVGGHVAYPKKELGAAYDDAMRTTVFEPLKMKSTTFDFKKALAQNHASAHSSDVDGKPAHAVMELNYSIPAVRPAGGAWSNVSDMLRYVQMELDEGALPGGKRYIGRESLLARRAPQVSVGKDAAYGMGLAVDQTWGVPVVHHGGDLIGYHSDMLWLPEQNVGAVILTNSDPGALLRGPFQRKLLELMFDGEARAERELASSTKRYFESLAVDRRLQTVPADAEVTGKLAARYWNQALGEIKVVRDGGKTIFDLGEWRSEVATRKEADGSTTIVTIAPGIGGLEFVPGAKEKRTLTTRDAQHEYVFEER